MKWPRNLGVPAGGETGVRPRVTAFRYAQVVYLDGTERCEVSEQSMRMKWSQCASVVESNLRSGRSLLTKSGKPAFYTEQLGMQNRVLGCPQRDRVLFRRL